MCIATLKSISSVEILGIHKDDKLSFDFNFNSICRSDSNQLSALITVERFLSFNAKMVLINSCIVSKLNYCPLM